MSDSSMENLENEPIQIIGKKKEIADCLSTGRFVHIKGDITEDKVPAWESKIEDLLQSPDPIVLLINTYGGDISALWAVTGALMEGSFTGDYGKREKIRRVYALAVEDCRSAGFEALMLGTQLDGAFATANTIIQFHGSTTPEEFPDEQLRTKAAEQKNFVLFATLKILSIRTGIDFEKLRKFARENVAYSAQEAKKLGIIEDIYDGPIPENLLTKE